MFEAAPGDLNQCSLGTWDQDALRWNPIYAGVCRIERPVYCIETNFSVDAMKERCIYGHYPGEYRTRVLKSNAN